MTSQLQLICLLPCHSLEDFPTYLVADEADGLLGAWAALWHPQLLAAAGAIPTYRRGEAGLTNLHRCVVAVPSVCEQHVDYEADWDAQQQHVVLLRHDHDPHALAQTAIEWLQQLDPSEEVAEPATPAAWCDDFFALGYAYLQVELLTRRMHYSSNLDVKQLTIHAVAAAQAVVRGDDHAGREELRRCFGVLAEERDHYYPVEVHLIDVTLLAPPYCDQRLQQQLALGIPVNLMASGQTVEYLRQHWPDLIDQLKSLHEQRQLAVIGGEHHELPSSLVHPESVWHELQSGIEIYRNALGWVPESFGRRRYGLHSQLPQLVAQAGWESAVHFTLDGGVFPAKGQAKTKWEGADGTLIDSLGRVPLDAGRPETYLNLGTKLGGSMEIDYVATLVLAHWPGETCYWYHLLQRVAAYGPVLGRFTTIDQYFQQTDYSGQRELHDEDKYASPYLQQSVARQEGDPISRYVRYWHREWRLRQTEELFTWGTLLLGDGAQHDTSDHRRYEHWEAIHRHAVDGTVATTTEADCERDVEERRMDAARRLVQAMFKPANPSADHGGKRHVLINSDASPVRYGVCVEEAVVVAEHERIQVCVTEEHEGYAVVDVPGCGFMSLRSGSAGDSKSPRRMLQSGKSASLVDATALTLSNEFMRVTIDDRTGGIRSLYDYTTRGNRLSQKLIWQVPRSGRDPRPERGRTTGAKRPIPAESQPLCHSVTVARDNACVGEFVCRGQMTQHDASATETTAIIEFEQRVRLWRGSRVVEVELTLEGEPSLTEDPWQSYIGSRVAWASDAAEIYRDLQCCQRPTSQRRFESPQYIGIDEGFRITTILTRGLPFHRRIDDRMLDTMFVVRGENSRQFRWAYGIDLPSPIAAARQLAAPPVWVDDANRSAASTGWLFHVDAKHVTVTAWEGRVDGQAGFRVRLLETSGQGGITGLAGFQKIKAADKTDFMGRQLESCEVRDGVARINLRPYEWTEVRVSW
ncbi:MAG: hypothetical protein R3E01_32320 [Pirellulaceae bacterium]|nr:hypothetical protein [Planctomycetales bacterium]